MESVSPTDRHWRDALDFCNLSGCDQLVRCPTHIAGNRLDLDLTDAPDRVDVFVGTPLGTSDHSIVSCVLRVEQCVPEHNVRSTVFLKHCTNWEMSAVQSGASYGAQFSGQLIHQTELLVRSLIGLFLPVLRRSGDKQWFDASCRRAYDAEQIAYNIVPGVEHAV